MNGTDAISRTITILRGLRLPYNPLFWVKSLGIVSANFIVALLVIYVKYRNTIVSGQEVVARSLVTVVNSMDTVEATVYTRSSSNMGLVMGLLLVLSTIQLAVGVRLHSTATSDLSRRINLAMIMGGAFCMGVSACYIAF